MHNDLYSYISLNLILLKEEKNGEKEKMYPFSSLQPAEIQML